MKVFKYISGSGDEVGRWGHGMYNTEPGSTVQRSALGQSEPMQGTRQQSLGLPCQHNDVGSHLSSRRMKYAEARTSSPGSGDGSSPNRVRKPER